MRILDRISITPTAQGVDDLKKLGLLKHLVAGKTAVVLVDREDTDLREYLHVYGRHIMSHTEFSEKERAKADYLTIFADWQFSYPFPENPPEVDLAVFGQASSCQECGVHSSVQKAPYKASTPYTKAPRPAGQLHWVYDQLFIWDKKLQGIFSKLENFPLHDRRGNVVEGVVQPVVPTGKIPLSADHLDKETCRICESEKISPDYVGYFPKLAEDPRCDIYRSPSWIGAGGSAFRPIVISAPVYRKIRSSNITGFTFEPLAN